ncbi:MAG: phosphatase PAP2 family protein [Candidatus Nomurabacteria bacterium]|nr:phosphatase PAP2 family protein [Candidatus Nomurabacteria bacterium]
MELWKLAGFNWFLDFVAVFLAEYLLFGLMVGLILAFVFCPKWRKLVILMVISVILSVILGKIAGLFFYHEQPFFVLGFTPLVGHAVDNSFPSDHSLVFFATFWTILLYFLGSGWRVSRFWARFLVVLTGILAVLVGLSRIFVGVHYPIDVLASIVISGVAAVIVYFAARVLTKKA